LWKQVRVKDFYKKPEKICEQGKNKMKKEQPGLQLPGNRDSLYPTIQFHIHVSPKDMHRKKYFPTGVCGEKVSWVGRI
jgi:hypothetical protein